MNVQKFSEEFTELVNRWRRPIQNKDGTSAPSLTSRQIVYTVQAGLHVILGDTSVSRSASLNNLLTLAESNEVKSIKSPTWKSQEKIDIDENGASITLPKDKKIISQSGLTIHASSIPKSDTFIREQAEKDAANAFAEREKKKALLENETLGYELQMIMKKIDSLREYTSNVVSNMNNLDQDVVGKSTKPRRRLSLVGATTGMKRSSPLMRSIPSSKNRRSVTRSPGTSTPSNLNTTITAVKKNAVSTRRSTIVGAGDLKNLPKVSSSINSPMVPAISVTKNSPVANSKTSKNSKYAHVQSTIPKVLAGKRKAE
ncbi:PREDICTED: uncharacterized protein LOC107192177 [Dufourea novaeangliae]|uniref:Uncharacterized protein n=1 Tax=Dufourea novaeangliae TaxID=178035 RepID=A0A154PS28_DUFNO|nr:PREDICTED: uncharacterized protein LOC107192177 [Dufourea novaeangliae]KZC14068.1 hypothetical protein WN55_06566 [Dufourea novaeangliae]